MMSTVMEDAVDDGDDGDDDDGAEEGGDEELKKVVEKSIQGGYTEAKASGNASGEDGSDVSLVT